MERTPVLVVGGGPAGIDLETPAGFPGRAGRRT